MTGSGGPWTIWPGRGARTVGVCRMGMAMGWDGRGMTGMGWDGGEREGRGRALGGWWRGGGIRQLELAAILRALRALGVVWPDAEVEREAEAE